MKKLIWVLAVAILAANLAGCNSCRRGGLLGFGLFNRGGRCNECPPDDCGPGMPRATMMLPGSAPVMPGPIEIAPGG